jgi:hypothetical protein
LVSHSAGIFVDQGSAARLCATLWHDNATDAAGTGKVSTTRDRVGLPGFSDPGGGDYHITLRSAALDRGLDVIVPTDIDGDVRPDRCASDLGADELVTGVECKRVYFPVLGRGYRAMPAADSRP